MPSSSVETRSRWAMYCGLILREIMWFFWTGTLQMMAVAMGLGAVFYIRNGLTAPGLFLLAGAMIAALAWFKLTSKNRALRD